jgi:hypothetical protein
MVRCIDVIFFRSEGHSVINKYFVLLNMTSVYHIVTIRVNETSWAHVWRLRFCYLRTGYDKLPIILHLLITITCLALPLILPYPLAKLLVSMDRTITNGSIA